MRWYWERLRIALRGVSYSWDIVWTSNWIYSYSVYSFSCFKTWLTSRTTISWQLTPSKDLGWI